VPGNTSTTFIRWNVDNAGADANSNPTAQALARYFARMIHLAG